MKGIGELFLDQAVDPQRDGTAWGTFAFGYAVLARRKPFLNVLSANW